MRLGVYQICQNPTITEEIGDHNWLIRNDNCLKNEPEHDWLFEGDYFLLLEQEGLELYPIITQKGLQYAIGFPSDAVLIFENNSLEFKT